MAEHEGGRQGGEEGGGGGKEKEDRGGGWIVVPAKDAPATVVEGQSQCGALAGRPTSRGEPPCQQMGRA